MGGFWRCSCGSVDFGAFMGGLRFLLTGACWSFACGWPSVSALCVGFGVLLMGTLNSL